MKNLKDKILSKIFFPKTIIINNPGIIFGKFYVGFGIFEIKRRLTCFFEDNFVDLEKEMIKKIGKKETSIIFYNIGKDIGIKYGIQMFKTKIPRFIGFEIFDKILERFTLLGYTITKKVKVDKKNLNIVLQGKNNIICRKSGGGYIFPGVFAGVLSYMFKESLKAEKTKCSLYNDYCEIKISKDKKKYKPNKDLFLNDNIFSITNYPSKLNYFEPLYSFQDLMKFKKVNVNGSGKYYLEKKSILTTDINFPTITTNRLIDKGFKEIMAKTLTNSSKKILSKICKFKSKKEKLNFLKNYLAAIGWGIPIIEENKKIKVTLIHPPRTHYGFDYYTFTLNGFLNFVYSKNLSVISINEKNNIKTVLEFS